MTSTRRKTRASTVPITSSDDEDQSKNNTPIDKKMKSMNKKETKVVKKDTTTPNKKNDGQRAKKAREAAKRQLKTRESGMGLKIDAVAAIKGTKKIVFDSDDDENYGDCDDATDEVEARAHNNVKDSDGDSGDDSDVEEVTAKVSREQTLIQRNFERETKSRNVLTTKRKKKVQKSQPVESENLAGDADPGEQDKDLEKAREVMNDDDAFLTDDFLAKVDSAKLNTIQTRKMEDRRQKRKGKLTTFVLDAAQGEEKPKRHRVDHNIEVVVLGNTDGFNPVSNNVFSINRSVSDPLSASMGTNPSVAAQRFAHRGCLQTIKSKKNYHRFDTGATWKRSKSMAYQRKLGQAAMKFT